MSARSCVALPRTFAAAVLILICAGFVTAQVVRSAPDLVPTGKGWGEARNNAAPAATSSNGINYHGGPVLTGTPNVYFIWYGCWGFAGQTCRPARASDSQTTVGLLNTFLNGLGGSGYEMINSTYYQVINQVTTSVSGNVVLANSATDNYSQGTRLSDSKVLAVVARAINSGSLPSDTNGVYFVLTSSDVAENSGFCTRYCGWHTNGSINGADIKYSFVGNPDRCPNACEWQTNSPNGDSGADGMASIIAHEQEEAISDPDLNAWYDSSGEENADKCAWRFGPTQTTSSGAQYNENIGGLNWLIQMNWENAAGGGCEQTQGGPFY